ncbi:MAG: hypothetical protein JW915_24205 [Chitinispirillaceae bacterium]|nr:hypothetical protein [Chitinispirillaceae bacterium]
MSTAPSGWETPVTDYAIDDGLLASDLNRIENNINRIENENRTLNPASAPLNNTATLRELLDMFAHQIGKMMGDDWYSTVKANVKDSFWLDGTLPGGFIIPASPAAPLVFAATFTIVPPGKKLILSQIKFHASNIGSTTGPTGHIYSVFFSNTYPDAASEFYWYHASRSGLESLDWYQMDEDLDVIVYTNNTENDKTILIELVVGQGPSDYTTQTSYISSQVKVRFDLMDI